MHRRPRFTRSLGAFDTRRTPVLRTDVLVIGGGIAGLTAALHAAAAGANVLMAAKTPFEDANTAWAQGGLAAVLGQDDSFELHERDTLRVGAGLADPAVVRQVVADAPAVVDWLVQIGTEFDRDPTGRYVLSREGGHSVARVVHSHGDSTGIAIEQALLARARAERGVTIRSDSFARDLLVEDGRCVGAVLLDRTDELAIQAGAVVLASGGAGQVYRETTNPNGACGDGVALGIRAGARVSGMEFVQFHPTTLYIAGAARFLISEVVRGAGAVLRDRNGERFMTGIHPDAELAPRDVVSRAILQRMVATGDTHVYLDLSTVRGDPHALFPSISRICGAFDIDIARDPVPVRPGAHYMIGGIESTLDGQTSLPGLLVAGEVASTGLHGANRLASNSLLEGAVMGRAAGLSAAEQARDASGIELPRWEDPLARSVHGPRIQLDDMLYSLKSMMWRLVGLDREAQGLTEARDRIGFWLHYLTHGTLRTRQACELANMLTTSALIAIAALAREESRGTHFRRDFPHRDDEHWCRQIRLQLDPDGHVAVSERELVAASDPRR